MTSRRVLLAVRSLLALALVALACLALPAVGLAGGKTGLPANTSLLFALSSKGGRLVQVGKPRRHVYTLTLKGVDREVTWFADRPHRDAGRLAAPRLLGDWGLLGFRKSPPNAALVVSGARADEDTMALALRLRRYDPRDRTATFSARALGSVGGGLRHLERRLDARVPSHFRDASLFIDNGDYGFSGCTMGRPQLMAVESKALREAFQEPIGFVPAEGQVLPIQDFEALYALIGPMFEEEEFAPSTANFRLPDLPAPAGTSWYMCANGWFPEEGEFGEGLIGEVAYFPPWVTRRAEGTWQPADGRTVPAADYPAYAQFYGGGATSITLPNVPALDGLMPMVDMEVGTYDGAPIGQLRMFVAPPQVSATEWAPATGGAVSAAQFPGLANLVGAGVASGAPTIRLPLVPSPAPGVGYYVAETGIWPLRSM